MNQLIAYFQGDVRRINHALKVYGLAKSIAEMEKLPAATQEVLEAAAILHDIGIKNSEQKYNSAAGTYQELEGPPVAKALLRELNLPVEIIDRVCFLIGHHHTYSKIEGVDFQILVEADFLVNIFEDGIKKEQIKVIRDKYFKTAAGKALLDSMYLND
ncbi:hypothetical protein P22_2765 [Propionispora sp. 2/2-37]|uniref:HD domain-containing protein n=1 Tax=Propionispora sp. 2/2-37 TaxID=1677858 RepID=UPI0006BB8A2A|nr:HD domain-containing protein [Propionispora sp. 2/2-37]CUH96675.1 hypothetical protein P22_2765 [Propionispora sp. 2/2-37]